MRTVSVFCGSSSKVKPIYFDTASSLGLELARRGVNILCGGVGSGLMRALIDGALEANGSVTGIVLQSEYKKERVHSGLTSVISVENVGQRKNLMISSSDAFITLPGSVGTLDEYFEVLAYSRAGFHSKPSAVLNVEGFFDHLIMLLKHMENEGFIKSSIRTSYIFDSDISSLLLQLEASTYSY